MNGQRWAVVTATGLGLLLSGGAPLGGQERPGTRPPPGWIGIAYGQDREPGTGEGARSSVLITGVVRGSPAHRAGLQPGDTIVAVDGSPGSRRALYALSRRLRPGEPVVLTLGRAGGRVEVRVVADPRPGAVDGPPLPPRVVVHLDSVRRALLRNLDSLHFRFRVEHGTGARARTFAFDSAAADALRTAAEELRGFTFTFSGDSAFGFRFEAEEGLEIFPREAFPSAPGEGVEPVVEPGDPPRPPNPWAVGRDYVAGARVTSLNPGLARYFSVNEGILVTDVLERTPAEEAGLEPGDVIVSAGERTPTSVAELRFIVGRSGGPVPLTVVRRGASIRLRLPR
ncbi:MAG: PDZ domain-containing protein [Gemmatimonadetes bacterium]|nr:PDZ domain-containing protein [Gemmatimonadota bacterium]NIR80363.1 PDZ domain-containing protein [Gemmatimonadota bacterium]NIT89126.1 PDZ domain-containing protein [Gemmatimonadota bacterium]NIU32923.1 PDZ domain-containing protein [Gemmatimonadota bacterium]NIU37322.1 PDZ domain-containing protein [Gemmatimonadota bacterium]